MAQPPHTYPTQWAGNILSHHFAKQPFRYKLFHPESGDIVDTTLSKPSLGILYAIQASGLPGLRPPRYREGRTVTEQERRLIPEWIADEVPEGWAKPVEVIIGPDIVSRSRTRFTAESTKHNLPSYVRTVVAAHLGNLAFLAELLQKCDKDNPREVASALDLARQLS